MKMLHVEEASTSLHAVLDQVADADVTVICRPDAPVAVVMSLDYYNSLMETVHLLNAPTNAARLARSIDQARSGQAQHRNLVNDPDAQVNRHG